MTDQTKDFESRSRADEAKDKPQGEGLGRREPQNPDKPEANQDLPEVETTTETTTTTTENPATETPPA